jgi:hypothetical protein
LNCYDAPPLILGAFQLLVSHAFKAGRIVIYQPLINIYPIKENEMNRYAVVAALLALSLSACGEKTATSQAPAAPVAAPVAAAPAASAPAATEAVASAPAAAETMKK